MVFCVEANEGKELLSTVFGVDAAHLFKPVLVNRIPPLMPGCLLMLGGIVWAAPVTASISGERGLAFRPIQ